MSRLKNKGKVKIEDVTKAFDKHLPVTSAVLGKKRKNDEVVITKVVEPPPKVDSLKDNAALKTWDDFTREGRVMLSQVSKLGSKFVEDVIEKGKQIEYEYQLKAFQLNADKLRMGEALENLKEELKEAQLEKSRMQVEIQRQQKTVSADLIEAQKQVASLSQEVADLTSSLAAKEVEHAEAMKAAVQNVIDSTAKVIAENRIQMIKDHLDGNYTGWDLEKAEKELEELLRGDGEVDSRLAGQVAHEGKDLSKDVDSGEENEEEAVVEAPKKKKK